MIASIYNNDSLAGFRILDADSNKTMDVPVNSVLAAMKQGNKIINLEIKNGKLKGSNGDISRYAKIVNGGIVGNSPVVILNQLGEVGYTVSDHTGKVLKAMIPDIITYANKNGIANGKISSKNGVEFISAISGTYDYIDIPDTNKTQPVKEQKQTPVIKPEVAQPNDTKPVINTTQENESAQAQSSLNAEQKSVLKDYYSWIKLEDAEAEKELQYINRVIVNNSFTEANNKTRLLNEILVKLGGITGIGAVFGSDIGSKLIRFIKTGMPLPGSLVNIAVSEMSKDISQTYKTLFYEFSDTINNIFKTEYTDTFRIGLRVYLEYAITRAALGDYKGYDTDEDRENKQIASKYGLCYEYTFNEIRAAIGTLNLIDEIAGDIRESKRSFDNFNRYNRRAYYGSSIPVKSSMSLYFHYAIELRSPNEDYGNSIFTYGIANSLVNITSVLDDFNEKDLRKIFGNGECNTICDKSPIEKYPNCVINSTPFVEHAKNIQKVYGWHLETLEAGESKVAYQFVKFCEDSWAQYLDKLHKQEEEKAAAETARLAAEMQQKREERERKEREERETRRLQEKQRVDTENKNSVNNSTSNETVSAPLRQTNNTDEKTQMQLDIDNGADISQYDRVELYKELKGRLTSKPTDFCFVISDDMIARRLKYRDMSSKQKYRLNEAIDIMIKTLNIGSKSVRGTDTNTSTSDSEVNNTYPLDTRPDIKKNIDRLIEKSNSVEMQAVLKDEPSVLKICYSILRYKKASDRQLKHVNNAIRLLDAQ